VPAANLQTNQLTNTTSIRRAITAEPSSAYLLLGASRKNRKTVSQLETLRASLAFRTVPKAVQIRKLRIVSQ